MTVTGGRCVCGAGIRVQVLSSRVSSVSLCTSLSHSLSLCLLSVSVSHSHSHPTQDRLIKHVNADGRVHITYSSPSLYAEAVAAEGVTMPSKTDDFLPYADVEHGFWSGAWVTWEGECVGDALVREGSFICFAHSCFVFVPLTRLTRLKCPQLFSKNS